MKPIKIGCMDSQASGYQLHKNRKLKYYETAYNICSKFVVITDEDLFKKDFFTYTFNESKRKLNVPYADRNEWAKMVGLHQAELAKIQENYSAIPADISSSAIEPDFNIYITTAKQKKIYEQLQAICEILNKEPEYMNLFFNGTNQFSQCIQRADGKAEINANWISQIC
jgi:hypothetical protein